MLHPARTTQRLKPETLTLVQQPLMARFSGRLFGHPARLEYEMVEGGCIQTKSFRPSGFQGQKPHISLTRNPHMFLRQRHFVAKWAIFTQLVIC